MASSFPTRSASFRASTIVSSIEILATGTSGQTSVAPNRGCSPWCLLMSITWAAFFIPLNAASTTASGSPTNVTTVLFVAFPGSTSSSLMPSTLSMASVISFITLASLPSEKFGTHSSILFISGNLLLPAV